MLKGWHAFIATINQINGTGLTLRVVLAFGLDHIAQELGDLAIKAVKGKRYFRQARDKFWESPEAQIVKGAIKKDFGQEILSVDTTFDYCLTKLKDRFTRRDVFVAASDLCRSFVVLSALALISAIRIAFCDIRPIHRSMFVFVILTLLLTSIAMLAWKRMIRFRGLSETNVFTILPSNARPRDQHLIVGTYLDRREEGGPLAECPRRPKSTTFSSMVRGIAPLRRSA